jgi:hypothetical protein
MRMASAASYFLSKMRSLNAKPPLWDRRTELVGLDISDDRSWAWLKDVVLPYMADFRLGRHDFHLVNGSFMAVDAHVYYGVIRHNRPKHIIEIGAGLSTVLAASTFVGQDIVAIDPNPNPVLNGINAKIIAKRVEDISLAGFDRLERGDILFIDSSHMLTTGGDIVWEYCEILPRLKSGVLVHVHDIYLPEPYTPLYHKQGLYYNEQYVLQAFLAFNSRFKVRWPGAWMYSRYPKELTELFPEIDEMRKVYPMAVPSSFWMEVV